MSAYLTGIPIFAGLDEAAIDLLLTRAQTVRAPAQAIIMREGEPGNRMCLIVSGSIRVWKHFGEPTETLLANLNPGDFFGEMCILETLPRAATIQAVEDTSLLSIGSLDFLHLYEAMPKQYCILVLNLARDLSRRLRSLGNAISAPH
jgi:CRP-like cAMP-binding protein